MESSIANSMISVFSHILFEDQVLLKLYYVLHQTYNEAIIKRQNDAGWFLANSGLAYRR